VGLFFSAVTTRGSKYNYVWILMMQEQF